MNRIRQFSFITRFFLAAFLLITVVGCKEDDEDFEPKLFLENEAFSVANTSSKHTIIFLTNQAWQAETDADWISLEQTSGEKGKVNLSFTVAENDDDARSGRIMVTANGVTQQEIVVTQEAGNRDDIYVKVGATGEGYSWNDATSLENALSIAVSGNTIHIAEGVYTPTVTVTGGDAGDAGDVTFEISKYIRLKGGYPADATEGSQANPQQYVSTLSGGGVAYHVVTVSAPKTEGQKVVLEGLKITDGKAGAATTSAKINGISFRRDYGGGITIGNAVVDILNTEVVDNKSDKNVAGLYAFGGSVVTLRNSKINRNLSAGNAGGIWISESVAHIFDSEVKENEGGTAAGVHGYPDATVNMYNSVIADNKGRSYGAAFYIRENSKGLLVNCLINGNTSTSANGGGGVMMYNNNEAIIINSTITGNTIAGPGGGIYRRAGVNTVSIYNSIVSGNTQKDDGPDVDAFEADAPAPVVQASVLGSVAYDASGQAIEGATFNAGTMLSEAYVPLGANNPAMEHGMSVDNLTQLGNSQNPVVESALIAADMLHNSRSGLRTMGALVGGE
ncbi:right-handed parallel beta-helix repeat-containing protein [Pontibacter litorisediminis]|uniref:right-handed parallel beta-helix repeat-containing protein n=1 Tax=Pontibacter litorisediminis TaxID=1846260 RepID=UPI0023ED8EFE|nr:right-handed parallel beta-helix repeat-containing protein [Pontibacter litorisediminis]